MLKHQTVDVGRYAEVFKAIANPYRLRILMRLSSGTLGGCGDGNDTDEICQCVGALGEDLGIAPSTVSHHLKELTRAGLVKMRRRGRHIECRVDSEALRSLALFLEKPGAGQDFRPGKTCPETD
jgi:ArsR family transcriptional regulator, arsenate/arsenite/antimonite-responsive transcriptional repressor